MIGIDDTIERRWGRKIAARGIYRDPVRSSHGHFVKRNEREQPNAWVVFDHAHPAGHPPALLFAD